MNREYGKAELSLDAHQQAPLMTDWLKTWNRIVQAFFTMKRPDAKVIGEQLGIPRAAVAKIMEDPRFKADIREGLRQQALGFMPHAMGVIGEMMEPDKPDGIRLKAATWLIERHDTLFTEVLNEKPGPIPSEKSLHETAERLKKIRFEEMAKTAKDAEATNGRQTLEANGANGSHDAAGSAPLGELRREGGCDQPPVPGPVQARQVDVLGGLDGLGSPDFV